MENDFPIKKINAKEEVEFHNNNAITIQLVVTTGTNLCQYWMQKHSKLNKTEPTTSDSDNDEDKHLRLRFCER